MPTVERIEYVRLQGRLTALRRMFNAVAYAGVVRGLDAKVLYLLDDNRGQVPDGSTDEERQAYHLARKDQIDKCRSVIENLQNGRPMDD